MEEKDFKNETNICGSCGRTIEYSNKREKTWSEIKICNEECRRNQNKFDYREAILASLKERGPLETIRPSELLRPELKQDKIMIEHVRRNAKLLAKENKIKFGMKDGLNKLYISITQKAEIPYLDRMTLGLTNKEKYTELFVGVG